MTSQTAWYWSGQLLEHHWRSHVDPLLCWGSTVEHVVQFLFGDVETLSPEKFEKLRES